MGILGVDSRDFEGHIVGNLGSCRRSSDYWVYKGLQAMAVEDAQALGLGFRV